MGLLSSASDVRSVFPKDAYSLHIALRIFVDHVNTPSPFSFLFVLACFNFFTFLLHLSLSPSLPLHTFSLIYSDLRNNINLKRDQLPPPIDCLANIRPLYVFPISILSLLFWFCLFSFFFFSSFLYFIIIYANYSAVALASPFACFSYSFCLSSLVVSPALI